MKFKELEKQVTRMNDYYIAIDSDTRIKISFMPSNQIIYLDIDRYDDYHYTETIGNFHHDIDLPDEEFIESSTQKKYWTLIENVRTELETKKCSTKELLMKLESISND